MAGNKSGGMKTKETMLKRYGADFYRKIGAKGGKKGNTGGFASDKVGKDGLTGKQRASKVGAKGGSISRRTRSGLHE